MTSTPMPRELVELFTESEKLVREICRLDPGCAQILAEEQRAVRRPRSSPTAGLPPAGRG